MVFRVRYPNTLLMPPFRPTLFNPLLSLLPGCCFTTSTSLNAQAVLHSETVAGARRDTPPWSHRARIPTVDPGKVFPSSPIPVKWEYGYRVQEPIRLPHWFVFDKSNDVLDHAVFWAVCHFASSTMMGSWSNLYERMWTVESTVDVVGYDR